MKHYEITVDGQVYQVTLREISEAEAKQKSTAAPQPAAPAAAPAQAPVSSGTEIPAPMAGNVLSILVKPGDQVKTGDVLLILEAMKMENEIVSPMDGVVSEVLTETGQTVESGQLLIMI
ncbi:biotin/lipoyl-binding protein [Enterococcus sp. 669A]|uniref:Biotin/lipoyl-binding protein n=1 Tax=Candidatus Enterococcus moelleringii TaxID=2815325 RepID=A0ABS3LH80_9ENTE|nr:biotin/lipoyl-containing protein [Enterococcus sp. 669A]MBO1308071.1 biotin/lipoyl-binding protein [Enterococcus sp. 669A]